MKQSQDKLGQMPIGRLLLTMSVPMMISMFIQALYNVVDSMFVARLSEDALTAVTLAFPLQNVMGAVAIGTGVGLNALVSRSLGAGDRARAEKAANVSLFLDVVYCAAAIVLGLCFSRAFYTSQTDVESIVEYGTQYVSIVCCWSMGMFVSQGMEKLLIATGSATLSMVSQALGAVMNIILDPVFIFGLGPVPAFGVRGAAIATVIGQFGAALCALLLNLKYNTATRIRLRQMLPNTAILKDIYAVGIPSMITVGLGSITSYCMNHIFLSFSTTAAAVFGIWQKLQSFGFMPVFGMNNGTLAIYAYNHGAGRLDRVFATRKLALYLGIGITLAVTLLYELIPGTLLGLFSASDYMRSIGMLAIRLCAVSMVLGAACVILSSVCQSLGKANHSLLINICRQMAFPVAAAWCLSRFGKLELIWFAPIIAELGALVVSIALSNRVLRDLRAEADWKCQEKCSRKIP